MKSMTPTEYRNFLLERSRTGKLATVRKDGRPHVVPVWFDLDGDTIVFTTWHQTVKAANIRRDPRVCMCVDDETPPFDFVQIEGTAELINDSDALAYWQGKSRVDTWELTWRKHMGNATALQVSCLCALLLRASSRRRL